jgi:hypothetical protein
MIDLGPPIVVKDALQPERGFPSLLFCEFRGGTRRLSATGCRIEDYAFGKSRHEFS